MKILHASKKENLQLKTISSKKVRVFFEARVLCTEEGTMYDGERKKGLEQKETMIDCQSCFAKIIADIIEYG